MGQERKGDIVRTKKTGGTKIKSIAMSSYVMDG